jgi:hypothetical protein
MQTKKVVVLTVDEAKEALVQAYTDVLVGDHKNTADMIRSGSIKALGDIPSMSDKGIADQYAEMCHLGEELIKEDPTIDLVLVKLDEESYKVVGLNRFKKKMEEHEVIAQTFKEEDELLARCFKEDADRLTAVQS